MQCRLLFDILLVSVVINWFDTTILNHSYATRASRETPPLHGIKHHTYSAIYAVQMYAVEHNQTPRSVLNSIHIML